MSQINNIVTLFRSYLSELILRIILFELRINHMIELSVAESILESFHNKDIEKAVKIYGDETHRAVKLLVELGLVKLEKGKILLTGNGKRFIDLPLP